MTSTDTIERALGRIEGKLDNLDTQLHDIRKAHHDRMNRIDINVGKLEERLRILEKKQFAILAIASIVATMIGFSIKFI